MQLDTEIPAFLQRRVAGVESSTTAQDIQLGAQLAAQLQQMQLEQQKFEMLQRAERLKAQGQAHINNGALELGDWMAEGAKIGYANPEWEAAFWKKAGSYPQIMETDQFKGMVSAIENSKKAKQQFDEIMLKHRLDITKPDNTPADITKIGYATEWRKQAETAEAAGDTSKAAEFRRSIALLEGTMLAPTETIETFTDDMGNQGVRVVRGGPGASGELTTASKTDFQKRLLNFENMSGMSKRLLEALGPLDVGIAGWGQQVLVNEGLAQFFPGLASQSTTDVRSLLGTFNENMIKALKADAQVNKQEEARILSILPKPGPNESLPSATAKIVRAMREIHSLSLPVAKRLGQPVPQFPLSAEEIRELYKTGKLTDKDLIRELLNTYHPEALAPYK